MSVDRRVRVGSIELPDPVMTASGTAGHSDELAPYNDFARLGAVVVKSLAAFEWGGNPAPRVHATVGGMLNSVGLQGPGVAHWLSDDLPRLARHTPRIVVSIWGRTVEDYAAAADAVRNAPPEVIAVEVNLSCPNLDGGKHLFAHDPAATRAVMDATSGCSRPRWAKLSPNTHELVAIAGIAAECGAEAVTLTNTLLGLAIDPDTRRPRLGGGGGGLSGPAMHAVAVRAVFETRKAHPDLPIVGVGGIASGPDAVEMLMAGANAVQVGTASFADPGAPTAVSRSVERWCNERGVTTVSELVNGAHR